MLSWFEVEPTMAPRVLTASDWLWAVSKAGGPQGTVRVEKLVTPRGGMAAEECWYAKWHLAGERYGTRLPVKR